MTPSVTPLLFTQNIVLFVCLFPFLFLNPRIINKTENFAEESEIIFNLCDVCGVYMDPCIHVFAKACESQRLT